MYVYTRTEFEKTFRFVEIPMKMAKNAFFVKVADFMLLNFNL